MLTLSPWAEAALPPNVQLRLRNRAMTISANITVSGGRPYRYSTFTGESDPPEPWRIQIRVDDPLSEIGYADHFYDHPDGELAHLLDYHLTELGAE